MISKNKEWFYEFALVLINLAIFKNVINGNYLLRSEYQEKVNQQDHEEDDTITFNFKSTFYFNQEKSGSLTGDEELTVPNYFALAIVNLVLRDKPSAIPIVGE